MTLARTAYGTTALQSNGIYDYYIFVTLGLYLIEAAMRLHRMILVNSLRLAHVYAHFNCFE